MLLEAAMRAIPSHYFTDIGQKGQRAQGDEKRRTQLDNSPLSITLQHLHLAPASRRTGL